VSRPSPPLREILHGLMNNLSIELNRGVEMRQEDHHHHQPPSSSSLPALSAITITSSPSMHSETGTMQVGDCRRFWRPPSALPAGVQRREWEAVRTENNSAPAPVYVLFQCDEFREYLRCIDCHQWCLWEYGSPQVRAAMLLLAKAHWRLCRKGQRTPKRGSHHADGDQ